MEAVCQKESQCLGDLRVCTSFTLSPNRDEVMDHKNKYMVPENNTDSNSNNTNLLCVHEKDFMSFMKEGGEHSSLMKLREKVEARKNGIMLATVTALAWRKRTIGNANSGQKEEGVVDDTRGSPLKSEEKIRGSTLFVDPNLTQAARTSFLPSMSELKERCSTRTPRYSSGGSTSQTSPKRSSSLIAPFKTRRSSREIRAQTQPPTPVFDTVLGFPTKACLSPKYPKKKVAKTVLSTLKAATNLESSIE